MAIFTVESGVQTAVVGAEHVLSTKTVAGVYILRVDGSALQGGDEVEIRMKTRVVTGGDSRTEQVATLTGPLDPPHWRSEPIPVDVEVTATLTQTTGTARSFPWKLLRA
ncbi:MAG: hypothetical protein ACOX5Z_00230 [Desulfobulbus sp.]|jgi:hypothetical protein